MSYSSLSRNANRGIGAVIALWVTIHLRAITNEDNVRDGASRRFAYLKQGVCKRGHPLGDKHFSYGCIPCKKQRKSEREEEVQ